MLIILILFIKDNEGDISALLTIRNVIIISNTGKSRTLNLILNSVKVEIVLIEVAIACYGSLKLV